MSSPPEAASSPIGEQTEDGAWFEVPDDQVHSWDIRLQATGASLYQYPFWNEPLRLLFFLPTYVVYRNEGRDLAFACILRMTLGGFSLGLLKYGPVDLGTGREVTRTEVWKALVAWARKRRFVFLRVTHTREEALAAACAMPGCRRLDSFRLWPEEVEELQVPLQSTMDETLTALPHEVRRLIRRGQETGFCIRSSTDMDDFMAAWPLFEKMARIKGINLRPLPYFQKLMTLGTQAGCCRLYVAEWEGRPVQAILVAKVGRTTYLLAGALDAETLPKKRSSPSCLLHWHAIQDAVLAGAQSYHLGNRAGPVYTFKRKFHPVEAVTAPPVTLVIRPFLFGIWSMSILRLGPPLLSLVRTVVQRLRR